MLINCFEFHINLYLKEIEKKFDNKEEDIIKYFIYKGDNNDDYTALNNFIKSIELLTDEESTKNFPICKLYLISYIKMYLNKVAYYYMSNNQLNLTELIEFVTKINNNQIRIIIKYYFFKLLYNYSTNYE